MQPATTDQALHFEQFEIRPAERALLVGSRSVAVGTLRLRLAAAELATLENPRWPAHRLSSGLGARRLANVVCGGAERAAQQVQLTWQVVAAWEASGQDTAPIMGTLIDAELECGHVQAAIELGERVLDQLAATRDEFSRLMVRATWPWLI